MLAPAAGSLDVDEGVIITDMPVVLMDDLAVCTGLLKLVEMLGGPCPTPPAVGPYTSLLSALTTYRVAPVFSVAGTSFRTFAAASMRSELLELLPSIADDSATRWKSSSIPPS